MVNIIKLRKGLDIKLAGEAEKKKIQLKSSGKFCLAPTDFVGVTPKVVVKEGDKVKAGDALFINKNCPEVRFASPVSGTVKAVVRGDRRKVLGIVVDADGKQEFADFGIKNVCQLSGDEVINYLLEAGIFGYINQLPYAVSAVPTEKPKAIFVSALRDKPLAADFEFELTGQEKEWQAGLTALSRIAKTHLGIGAKQTASALTDPKDVEVTVFDGPCPAGNVGVQVNHIDPVNKGETVWTVEPTVVLFIGRLMTTGKVDLRRTVALVGSEVKAPQYVDMAVGEELQTLLNNSYDKSHKVRITDASSATLKGEVL